jgi:integrase
MTASKDGFKYLALMTMNTKSGIFYQLRLCSKLGRKTIGLGGHKIQALNIALLVDEEIERQIKAGDTVELDTLKLLVHEKLDSYRSQKQGGIKVVEKDDLRVLWDKYVDFHVNIKAWTETYILTHIKTVGSLVENCPFQRLEQKQEIVTWLFNDKTRTVKTSKDRFKIMVAAIDWCSKQGIVPRRWGIEYRDLLGSISIKGQKADNTDEDGNVDIFKVAEVYRIIDALKTDEYSRFKGTHSQYWRYVTFLWLTGCRPSEAIAMKWENVDLNKKQVKFCEGQINASGTIVKKKGTKTAPSRVFPINDELHTLLISLPSGNRQKGYVFTNKLGNAISQQALNGVWRGLLDKMCIRYRVPYQLRHTMISYHANNDFPLHKLAALVGNSEEVIREHYLKLDIERISLPDVIK